MIYGTLGLACAAALVTALAYPDALDVFEANLAAIYFTLIIGTNKTLNAKPICGRKTIGMISTFIAAAAVPATIIHVTIAQISPGQNEHIGTFTGYLVVAALSALIVIPFLIPSVQIWKFCEQQNEKAANKIRTKTPKHPQDNP